MTKKWGEFNPSLLGGSSGCYSLHYQALTGDILIMKQNCSSKKLTKIIAPSETSEIKLQWNIWTNLIFSNLRDKTNLVWTNICRTQDNIFSRQNNKKVLKNLRFHSFFCSVFQKLVRVGQHQVQLLLEEFLFEIILHMIS